MTRATEAFVRHQMLPQVPPPSSHKEFKAFNMRMQVNKSTTLLEDKLDGEFLERIMQVYAFFTSCLNLVLQNDSEAHKLLIL